MPGSPKSMTDPGPILVKRKPSMTREEFAKAWYRHGAIVSPWCLSNGVKYYKQTVNLRLGPKGSELEGSLDEWDGRIDIAFESQEKMFKVGHGFYENVTLPDERFFLVSEATHHSKYVNEGVVEGETTRVIIEGGKIAEGVVVKEEDWNKWYEWLEKDKKSP